MSKLLKYFAILCSLAALPAVADAAQNLTGIASVNVTSDTSATAKNMALSEARRQITKDVLSQYSDPAQLAGAMKDTKDSVLTNLIASVGIDGERLSATTYSANIRMTVDAVAAKKWLMENEVQNWLGSDDSEAVDKSTVVIDVFDGLRDWIALNHVLRENKIILDVKRISGDQVTASFPATLHSTLVSSVRDMGWKYSDSDGFPRIWK